jgi:carotenoid cleavage dioxygenase-like enzyme
MRRDADVSTIRWIDTEACYVFHPLNAFDEGDKLFADVMRYDVAPLFPNADGTPGQKSAALSGALDLRPFGRQRRRSMRQALDDLDGEFPRFDERVETHALSARLVSSARP